MNEKGKERRFQKNRSIAVITINIKIINDNSYLRNVVKEREQRLIISFFFNYLSIRDIVSYIIISVSFFFQTIGNHEFDNDVEGVVPFLKMVEAPVVVTNIDATEEPTMQVRSILISFSLKSFFFTRAGNWSKLRK